MCVCAASNACDLNAATYIYCWWWCSVRVLVELRDLLAVDNFSFDLLKQLWEVPVFGLQCLLNRTRGSSHIPIAPAQVHGVHGNII